MRTIVIGFSREILVGDLLDCLQGTPCSLVDSRCVVESGQAAVYLDIDLSELDPGDDWWLRSSLGGRPHSRVAVHIGHAEGSGRLAAEVVRRLVLFGGVVDPESDGIAVLTEGQRVD